MWRFKTKKRMAPPYLDFVPNLAGWKARMTQMARTEPKSWWVATFLPGSDTTIRVPEGCVYSSRIISQCEPTRIETRLMLDFDEHTYIVSCHSPKRISVDNLPREEEEYHEGDQSVTEPEVSGVVL